MNFAPITQQMFARRPRGVALLIVMVLLVIMTLLGLANLRGTVLEERMSANLLDRSLGFQSAEAALREGEAIAAARPVFPGAGCLDGLCAAPVGVTADRWTDASFNGWVNAAVALGGGAAVQPQFFIENLGMAPKWPACDQEVPVNPLCLSPRYRISARSVAADRAQVILQSNFAAP